MHERLVFWELWRRLHGLVGGLAKRQLDFVLGWEVGQGVGVCSINQNCPQYFPASEMARFQASHYYL